MRLNELKELKVDLDSIEAFKEIVAEAIEGECMFKEYGYWLSEEYRDNSSEKEKMFRANILCINSSYNEDTKYFRHLHHDVSSVTAYDIFYYRGAYGGSFVIDDTILSNIAIAAMKKLKVNRK